MIKKEIDSGCILPFDEEKSLSIMNYFNVIPRDISGMILDRLLPQIQVPTEWDLERGTFATPTEKDKYNLSVTCVLITRTIRQAVNFVSLFRNEPKSYIGQYYFPEPTTTRWTIATLSYLINLLLNYPGQCRHMEALIRYGLCLHYRKYRVSLDEYVKKIGIIDFKREAVSFCLNRPLITNVIENKQIPFSSIKQICEEPWINLRDLHIDKHVIIRDDPEIMEYFMTITAPLIDDRYSYYEWFNAALTRNKNNVVRYMLSEREWTLEDCYRSVEEAERFVQGIEKIMITAPPPTNPTPEYHTWLLDYVIKTLCTRKLIPDLHQVIYSIERGIMCSEIQLHRRICYLINLKVPKRRNHIKMLILQMLYQTLFRILTRPELVYSSYSVLKKLPIFYRYRRYWGAMLAAEIREGRLRQTRCCP